VAAVITLTPHQQEEMEKIIQAGLNGDQVITLSGSAGTGKTTLIAQIGTEAVSRGPWRHVVYWTSTGRAMVVLASKLNAEVKTFHSGVYGRGHEEKVQATDVKNNLLWDDEGNPKMIRTGRLFFGEPKQDLVEPYTLIVVDEASMIPLDPLHNDLMSVLPAGCSVLYVWDPKQLPPVSKGKDDVPSAPASHPQTAQLLEIHRQAWDNPVIRISDSIWTGDDPQVDWDGDGRLHLADYSEIEAARWRAGTFDDNVDATLVTGTNTARRRVNTLVRRYLHAEEIIEEGEILCCYRNHHDLGIMNGETFKVATVTEMELDFGWIIIATQEDDPRPIIIQPGTIGTLSKGWSKFKDEVWEHYKKSNSCGVRAIEQLREHLLAEGWTGSALHLPADLRPWEANKWMRDAFLYVDYGYCLTIHKSQGSEWDEVGVLLGDWLANHRSRKFSKQAQYTAVTRTKNKLLMWA